LEFRWSANGADENSPQFQLRVSNPKKFKPRRGGRQFGTHIPVVPLGLNSICSSVPQLKQRAIFSRRCAAGVGVGFLA
jgi:hypothetical protein